jgi:hypothetical protein
LGLKPIEGSNPSVSAVGSDFPALLRAPYALGVAQAALRP